MGDAQCNLLSLDQSTYLYQINISCTSTSNSYRPFVFLPSGIYCLERKVVGQSVSCLCHFPWDKKKTTEFRMPKTRIVDNKSAFVEAQGKNNAPRRFESNRWKMVHVCERSGQGSLTECQADVEELHESCYWRHPHSLNQSTLSTGLVLMLRYWVKPWTNCHKQ